MKAIDPKVYDTPPHFRYLKKSDHENHTGSEESIHHSLFKQALASIGTTRIRLKDGYHVLEISDAVAEVRLPVGDRVIRPDVRWRFTSDTLLDKKWDSTAYVEVCHKHPVPDEKLQALIAAHAPVIEVDIPDYLLFKGDDNASEDWQNKYLEFAKRQLEDLTHFLPGVVLSDPSSHGYIEVLREWNADKRALAHAQQELEDMRSRYAERQQLVQRQLVEARALVPVASTVSSSMTAPSFELLRADDPPIQPHGHDLEHETLQSNRGPQAWSWPSGMILGSLIVFLMFVVRDHWPIVRAEDSPVIANQPASSVTKLTEAPAPSLHRVDMTSRKAHAKKKTKKKSAATSSGNVSMRPTIEEASQTAPEQWFQVDPQSSEEAQSNSSPSQ